MNNINIIPNSTIYFKSALLLPKIIDFSGKRVVFVASPNVKEYVNTISAEFSKHDIEHYIYYLNDGESNKNLSSALELTNFLCEHSISRSDIIINIGGGTVCDLGAFVASVYMRGIKYINLPTTLLCACDASVGGKTAIDLNGFKNFWGTFYQPFAVIIDCDFLAKLSDQLLNEGLSEIVKYSIIDKNFYSKLIKLTSLGEIRENLISILYDCLKIKSELVLIDERDHNERKALNLGHTIAHAVESGSNYLVNHANAVAFGLVVESKIASELSLISTNRLNSILSIINRFLNTNCNVLVSEIIPFMLRDKKNISNKIVFSLPSEEGVQITELTLEKTTQILQKIL